MDEAAFPWQADWYRSLVEATLGPRLDDRYRLWFVDHAMHTSPMAHAGRPAACADDPRSISYAGVLQQALRDLSNWVEHGMAPPASTNYEVVDGQVQLPPTVEARKGIQPIVSVTANGRSRADVAVGETVEFSAVIEVPAGTGMVVGAEWDFEGGGDYPVSEPFDNINAASSRVTVAAAHAFSEPGTYFPALRATSQREGDVHSPFAAGAEPRPRPRRRPVVE